MKQWSFYSSSEDFDGERIQREAINAGLQVWKVTRNGTTIQFATSEAVERGKKVGIHLRILMCGIIVPQIYKGIMLVDYVSFTNKPFPMIYEAGEDVFEWFNRVKQAEANWVSTTVCGRY